MNLTLYVVYLLDVDEPNDLELRTLIGTTIHRNMISGMINEFAKDVDIEIDHQADIEIEDFELPVLELKEFFNQN